MKVRTPIERQPRPQCAMCCAFAVVALLAISKADAADTDASAYPNKPVRMIVPYPPGGGSDVMGRAVAGRLGEQLGQQFIVDNRGGASTTIGAGIAAKAVPDGYSLLLGTITTLATNPNLRAKLPYDPGRSFDPISLFASQAYFLFLHPGVPARSVRDFLAYARANPGKLNFGSPGVGSGAHLTGELFNHMANTKLVHVGYKGAGPAMIDLVSGQIPLMFATFSTSYAMYKTGKIVPIAVSTPKRTRSMPELPTLAESGLSGFSMRSWNGLLAPKGTPKSIVDKLSQEIGNAMNNPSFTKRLMEMGFEPDPMTPSEFAAFIREEIDKHALIIKMAGLKVE
jgi:tripartite-type tricarboxylate transporter receptor subunit TctC